MPIPPTTVEGDERLNEAPPVLSDTHETHDAEEYDERATKFWSVYIEEAENHNKALVETWKDDMKGILIFVRIPLSPLSFGYNAQVMLFLPGWFVFSQLDCLSR